MSPIRNLSLRHKLLALILLLSLPLGLSAGFFFESQLRWIGFADAERQGVEYLQTLEPVRDAIVTHQGLLQRQREGDASAATEVEAARARVDQALERLAFLDERLGGALRTGRAVTELKDGWRRLRTSIESLPGGDGLEQQSALLDEVQALVATVGDSSNLILDPDLQSYYLMDVLVNNLPVAMDRLSSARDRAIAGLSARSLPEQLEYRLSEELLRMSLRVEAL
ncbi:MAG: hypothetical protein KDK91_33060, partial [Gammaproteobacteria bacterium]|nr:hypothetical protein [Gammaproteobacteria bacterium]